MRHDGHFSSPSPCFVRVRLVVSCCFLVGELNFDLFLTSSNNLTATVESNAAIEEKKKKVGQSHSRGPDAAEMMDPPLREHATGAPSEHSTPLVFFSIAALLSTVAVKLLLEVKKRSKFTSPTRKQQETTNPTRTKQGKGELK